MILSESMTYLASLLLGANVIAFFAFGLDKRAAKLGNRRVPEARLLLWVLLGGGAGALAGQRIFRHKTKKQPFKTRMWAIIFLQIVGLTTYLVWRLLQ